ncbi:hypothetical protein [Nocardia neocaledoniensis]|uniref:hypothetical protein n=1 Tax=Nocardia neocaledoniensis TaxID=236511 RepID=UPI002458FE90|nr:hypothetical protein [Nocardia neocaledoniensis]
MSTTSRSSTGSSRHSTTTPNPADIEHTRRWYQHRHRSLSVGDIVTVDHRRYACTPWSWDALPTD